MALTPISLSNPIFQGGLGLMLLGGAMAMARNIPVRLWHLVTRGFWLECYIDGWDPAFYWVNQWLASQPEVENSNLLRVESRTFKNEDDNRDDERRSMLVPGIGEHVVTIQGAKFWLSVVKEEIPPKKTDGPGTGDIFSKPLSLKIRCRSKHRGLLRQLLDEADGLSRKDDPTRTKIWLPYYSEHWQLQASPKIRKTESIVLAGTTFQDLRSRLQKFVEAKTRYYDLGVPYRIGCLLYGRPGNGKSSVVVAIAGALGRDLYVLSLGDQNLDDNKLLGLLSKIPNNAVCLIEDVDAIFRGRDRQAENKLTFSGLVNAIDGALASEGRILFQTTNHIEVLDPALIRDGRCDIHLELHNAVPEQAERLYQRFFPQADPKAFGQWAGTGQWSMAALQGHLLKNQNNPELAAQEPHTQESHE